MCNLAEFNRNADILTVTGQELSVSLFNNNKNEDVCCAQTVKVYDT